MPTSPDKFAELLTSAVYQIKAQDNKNLQLIQDELGYVLGRDGGSFINYLRKGNVPTQLSDTEDLARELVHRQGMDRDTCEQFLRSGGYPGAERLVDELFRTEKGGDDVSEITLEDEIFITGPPIVQPHQFFGRERELRRIFRHWRRSPLEHITVIGARRSGKTSLLHYIKNIMATAATSLRPGQKNEWLAAPVRYQWIWVDFQDPRMRNQEHLQRYLLEAFGESAPEGCNLDTFLNRMTDRAWNRPTIILMDEVGIGISTPSVSREFWDGLRSLVMSNVTNGNLGFMLAAHRSLVQLAEDRGKASPFWNMFVTDELGPLTEKEALELIASSPIPFADEDVAWILEQSQCWPCLLQFLCCERLMALEEGESDIGWREEGLRRIAPFAHLLE